MDFARRMAPWWAPILVGMTLTIVLGVQTDGWSLTKHSGYTRMYEFVPHSGVVTALRLEPWGWCFLMGYVRLQDVEPLSRSPEVAYIVCDMTGQASLQGKLMLINMGVTRNGSYNLWHYW